MQEFMSSELCNKLKLCNTVQGIKTLSGGSISHAACYSTDKGDFFVKTNTDRNASQWFKAEYLALERISEAVPQFAPKPLHHDTFYIVTEYIQIASGSRHDEKIQKKLGKQLANLHMNGFNDKFGFDVTSFCGTTELDNTWSTCWSDFYRDQRLKPLLDQVRGQNEELDSLGQQILDRMDHWLGADTLGNVKPSLLHGDLWSGNWAVTKEHRPMVFDPASYYGHNEVDFGIMRMFGGFTQDLFDAYDDAYQGNIAEGRQERLILYEMYHHLNHYAMFGGHYANSCIDLMEKITN